MLYCECMKERLSRMKLQFIRARNDSFSMRERIMKCYEKRVLLGKIKMDAR